MGEGHTTNMGRPARQLDHLKDRVKARRDELRMTQQELASSTGLGQSTIQNYESGRIPKGKELLLLAEVLRCSTDWLLSGSGPAPGEVAETAAAYGETVLVRKVQARWSARTGELETGREPIGCHAFRRDWLARKGDPEKMVLMEVFGDSMAPDIKDGDTVLIDQSQKEIFSGRIYAIGLDDEIVVKQIEKHPERYILRSRNPQHEDILLLSDREAWRGIRIVGRVIWWCHEER